MRTFHVQNFGCRATQADGNAIEQQFHSRGLSRSEIAAADLVVFNTCTVTVAADQDARAAIRRVRRQNPGAKIVVTGCYAQRAPEEVAALEGVSTVVGNSHKHQLAAFALDDLPAHGGDFSPSPAAFFPLAALAPSRATADRPLYVSDILAHTELLAAPVFEPNGTQAGDRTRPNLKVQDGCDNRCSFCIIPSVRGHSRSLSSERVIEEVNSLVAAGYKELVISGINLGRWGRDLQLSIQGRGGLSQKHSLKLVDLLRSILSQTKLEKLRISSVEPMDWSDDLIALSASSSRIAKHAHLPLQSASDAVLRRMHRKYRPWHYRDKIEKIRAAMPTAAIGADVMVGFPGESDSEFECTRRMIEDLPFTYLHVFTYSARPGTPAAAMKNQVPVQAARERNKILRDLAAEKKLAFMRGFIGRTVDAITFNSAAELSGSREVLAEALTDNFQKAYVKGRHAANQWLKVRVEDVLDDRFIGTAVMAA